MAAAAPSEEDQPVDLVQLPDLRPSKPGSKSSDAASVALKAPPMARQCKSDDSVLGEAQRQSVINEAHSIQEELAKIAEQEAKLKQRRRSLEARLVELYERSPQISDLSSRGLVAPVSAEAPQVEVASFFAGDHGHARARSLSDQRPPPEPLAVDHGPRSRVNSDASDHWPNVILTLDDVDLPEKSPRATAAAPQKPTQQAHNPFRDPPSSSKRPAGAGHRRSTSMSASRLSIRPAQQQSDRKSSPGAESSQRLQPPPPAKPRHRHTMTTLN